MATLNRFQPVWIGNTLNATEPLYRGGTGPKEYPHWKETASQTYGVGDLLFIDTNGTIAICTVAANLLTSAVAGQALAAATGVTGAQVQLRMIRPDDLFMMNVFHTTPASAVTVQTNLLAVFGLRNDTVSGNGTNLWNVDLVNAVEGTNNRAAHVRVVDFGLKTPDGTTVTLHTDVYAPVIVQFLPISIFNTNASVLRVIQGA